MNDKAYFRKKYKDLRSQLDVDAVDEMSMEIANRVLELPIWRETYYHTFLSISEKKEVDTQYLLHILHGRDKSVVVPKSNFNTLELEHYLLQENTPVKVSNYGIPEPQSGILIPPEQLDVVFVPLLAFDQNGGRVGYGKGFYDRFLSRCKKEAVFVGLSFFDAEETVPTASNDIPLNYCVTPSEVYTFVGK